MDVLTMRLQALQRAVAGRLESADECLADAKRHREYAPLAEATAQKLHEEVMGIQTALQEA